MAETTGISWCDSTFNPFIGCTKVSPGCDGCYAAVSTPARTFGVKWGAGEARRRTSPSNWQKPIRWNALAEHGLMPDGKTPTNGRRPRVFCASLADVFDNEVDPSWRWDLFDMIRKTTNLDWLLLTKRIGNVQKMVGMGDAGDGGKPLPPNVWLGASIVNQEEADRDIPKLLATPAAVRFVSYEPALGPVEWTNVAGKSALAYQIFGLEPRRLNWVIVGGESSQPGHPARPFDIKWARDTVRQCREAGVAVFFKQTGSNAIADGKRISLRDRSGSDLDELPPDLRVQEFPNA